MNRLNTGHILPPPEKHRSWPHLGLRQFGMLDIEDLRLPVAMTHLNYDLGSWNLMGVAIHEMWFNTEELYGSDYYPADIPE